MDQCPAAWVRAPHRQPAVALAQPNSTQVEESLEGVEVGRTVPTRFLRKEAARQKELLAAAAAASDSADKSAAAGAAAAAAAANAVRRSPLLRFESHVSSLLSSPPALSLPVRLTISRNARPARLAAAASSAQASGIDPYEFCDPEDIIPRLSKKDGCAFFQSSAFAPASPPPAVMLKRVV